jgi:hypothetical protein
MQVGEKRIFKSGGAAAALPVLEPQASSRNPSCKHKPKAKSANSSKERDSTRGGEGNSSHQKNDLQASDIINRSRVNIAETGLLPRNMKSGHLGRKGDFRQKGEFRAPERAGGGTSFADKRRYEYCLATLVGCIMIEAAFHMDKTEVELLESKVPIKDIEGALVK